MRIENNETYGTLSALWYVYWWYLVIVACYVLFYGTQWVAQRLFG